MDKDTQLKKLDTALNNFGECMIHEVSHTDVDSDTANIIDELSRQTFYALAEFKDVIETLIQEI